MPGCIKLVNGSSYSFLGGGFCKFKLLFLVGGVISLVNFVIIKVNRIETDIYVAIIDIIWVLFEQIHLSLDFPGLKNVKKPLVLWFVLFVFLEHHEYLVCLLF